MSLVSNVQQALELIVSWAKTTFATKNHTHVIADVTNLQTTLNGKAASSHNHTAAQTTSGTFAAARLPAATTEARGAVELATQEEAIAGLLADRAVTPSVLAAAIAELMPYRIWSGVINITMTATPGASVPIDFPEGRFTGNPSVSATRATSSAARGIPYVVGSSKTGAIIGLYDAAGTNLTGTFPIYVVAVQAN